MRLKIARKDSQGTLFGLRAALSGVPGPAGPRGPGEAARCREAKIAARQFLTLNCRDPHHGGNFETGKSVLSCGGETILGNENRTRSFFSRTFRAPPGYPGKIPGYPAKKSLISLVSTGIPNFLAPTPSCGRPPPHRKMSGLKSLGLGSLKFGRAQRSKKFEISIEIENFDRE